MMGYLEEFEAIVGSLKRNEPAALCIVVRKSGSAPRNVGAKMVVLGDGRVVGTLGGGPFERLVVKDALDALRSGKPALKRYVFREEGGEGAVRTGLICGGEVEVFVDVLKPAPRIILLGAGHLSEAIARVASEAGFRVSVADPSSKLATRERFPMAEEVLVAGIREGVARLRPGRDDFVLIVYGVVEEDFEALVEALKTEARYIGVLGSRRKSGEFLRRLREMGYSEDDLRGRVFMPIGLDIGAETPGEIAVAVVAELIRILRGGGLKHLSIL